jgi:signal transduction histidine kinase
VLDEAAAAAGLTGAAVPEGVRFRCECGGVDTAALDRRLMARVLVNLLTNARESLAGAGEIELSAEPEPGPRGEAGLVFRVRDTGRGMSEDFIRTALFRPFATTKPAGLGIGLSQCRGIVQAMGGAITVESRPGAGTTFAVHLPAAPPEDPGTKA